jgi:hypothetical protein
MTTTGQLFIRSFSHFNQFVILVLCMFLQNLVQIGQRVLELSFDGQTERVHKPWFGLIINLLRTDNKTSGATLLSPNQELKLH